MTTDDDSDLTMPDADRPQPVPSSHLEPDSDSQDGVDDTLVEGASSGAEPGPDPTLIEGEDTPLAELPDGTMPELPDATLIEGQRPTPVPASVPQSAARKPSGEAPKVFADRFEVEELLGEGGMGRVYVVRDRQIEGRRIALKVLRPRFSRNERFRKLFFKEIRAAQSFVSEQVTQVRDTGQMKDGTLFLTMDLVEGESLDKLLERETSLTPRHALEITRQILIGLASGHDQGFVHCDIKPPNVMLAARVPKTEDNPMGVSVRVLDFGIANLAQEMEAGTVIGTPRYMSPEQVQGQRLDARSDLFAAGVLLYEMLNGSRPFEGTTAQEVQTAVLETDVQVLIRDLDQLPEPIRKLLQKALQKDREKRFQSATEFIEAIEASKAYKEAGGLPKWVAGLVVLFFIATAGEALMLWKQQQLVNEQQGTITSYIKENLTLRNRFTEALAEAVSKAKTDQLNADNELISGKNTRITELEAENDDLHGQLDEIENDKKLKKLREESAAEGLRRDLTTANSKIAKLEKKVDDLKDLTGETARGLRPQRKAADFFDDLLRNINAGYPGAALSKYTRQAEDQALPIDPDQGADLVSALVSASDSIKKARSLEDLVEPGSDPGLRKSALQALKLGRASLAKAKALVGRFTVVAEPWIQESTMLNEQPQRLETVQELLVKLEADLAALDQTKTVIDEDMAAANAKEREQIKALPAASNPEALYAYIQVHGPDGLEQQLDSLGRDAEALLAPTGALNLQELARSKILETFETWLLGDSSAKLDIGGVETLRWLLAAKTWYASEPLPAELANVVKTIPMITATTPTTNWRAVLALEVALESSSQYPEMIGDAALLTRWNGTETWSSETINQDGEGSWFIERQVVTTDGRLGSHVEKLQVKRSGDTLWLDKHKIFDLRSGDAQAALWQHERVESLPEAPWTRNLDNQAYLETLESPIPCLVFHSADRVYWYSPTHGLVRQTRGKDMERELVYSSAVQ